MVGWFPTPWRLRGEVVGLKGTLGHRARWIAGLLRQNLHPAFQPLRPTCPRRPGSDMGRSSNTQCHRFLWVANEVESLLLVFTRASAITRFQVYLPIKYLPFPRQTWHSRLSPRFWLSSERVPEMQVRNVPVGCQADRVGERRAQLPPCSQKARR